MASELFIERYIKNCIKLTGLNQDLIVERCNAVAHNLFKNQRHKSEPLDVLVESEDTLEFLNSVFLGMIGHCKPHVMSPTLIKILSKTANDLKVNFIWKKARRFLSDTNLSALFFLDIQVNDLYGILIVSHHSIIVVFPSLTRPNDIDITYHLQTASSENLQRTINEFAEHSKNEVDPALSILFWKCVTYILCSGQPDLREVKEETRINSPKKIRKLNITKPIIPVIKVGLGFEKTPMYQTDEWERKGHFRLQPYGPKANPTHHDLIWIPNSIAKRKKPTIKQTLAGMQNNPKVFPNYSDKSIVSRNYLEKEKNDEMSNGPSQ